MLLVPAGATELPESVETFLRDVFVTGRLCAQAVGGLGTGRSGAVDGNAYAAAVNSGRCFAPGMAVAFGGEAVITSEVLAQASWLASGRLAPGAEPDAPVLVGAYAPHHDDPARIEKAPGAQRGIGAFATRLPIDGTVFHRADANGVIKPAGSAGGSTGAGRDWMCLPRGTYADARWLVVETSPDRAPAVEVDLTTLSWYHGDVDDVRRGTQPGSPACLAVELSENSPTYLRAVGPHGRTSRPTALAADANRRFWLTDVVEAADPVSGGEPSDVILPDGGTTRLAFRSRDLDIYAHLPPSRQPVSEAFVSVEIVRAPAGGTPDVFRALWSVETALGNISGIAEGEARFVSDRWELRGMSVVQSGSWVRSVYGTSPEESPGIVAGAGVAGLADDSYGAGGFMASIQVNDFGNDDDTIVWRVDSFINAAL